MAGSTARTNRRSRREALNQYKKTGFIQDINDNFPIDNSPQKSKKAQSKFPKLTQYHPRSPGQVRLVEALDTSRLVLACGSAGSGKTLFSISHAVDLLAAGDVEKIVLSRPAVGACGEDIGFLPGDVRSKLSPYLRPLFDAFCEKIGGGQQALQMMDQWIKHEVVEIAPMSFLRGRTFKNSAIILDEAQNATYAGLKMVLTRIGEDSTLAIMGDMEQSDISDGSGFRSILSKFESHGKYPVVRLGIEDVQRDEIVSEVLKFI